MMSEQIYDVALSFAGENRSLARRLAHSLERKGLNVFYNEQASSLWGQELHRYFQQAYKNSRFVVLLLSAAYTKNQWTTLELQTAVARSLQDTPTSVLPVQLDDSHPPSLLRSSAVLNARNRSPAEIAELIIERIGPALTQKPRSVKTETIIYNVIHSMGEWSVKRAGTARASRVFSRRGDAIAYAKHLLRSGKAVEIVIHGKDGSVEKRLNRETLG